jgi:cytochrome c-type biogenesis protein CcmH
MKLIVQMLALALLLVAADTPASAPLSFASAEQEQRFQDLTEELRCLVCQNQNLADSDAPLAQDLRQEIHDMLVDGRSDAEIRSFLVDRYGDFVLYRPAMKGNTLLLWLAPALLLLVGGGVVMHSVRSHRLAAGDDPVGLTELGGDDPAINREVPGNPDKDLSC